MPFPPRFLHREEIVGEDRLALDQIEPVAAEVPTIGDDHPLPTTGRNLDIRRDGVGLGEDVWCVAIGRAGQIARIGELGSSSGVAWLGSENALEVAILQVLLLPVSLTAKKNTTCITNCSLRIQKNMLRI